ncbi:MAG: hypothetical protein Ta2G_09700 [Termitinemataceae bacterium]|nr:MAG: hypothetical protein Ta2G_09700 [Termitinemataceae bacterium]
MSLLNSIEAMSRKSTAIFFIIDQSALHDSNSAKLLKLNDAINTLLPELQKAADKNTKTKIITDIVCGEGIGDVCKKLHAKLSTKAFFTDAAGYYPPVMVLFSAAEVADIHAGAAIETLHKNNWFKAAERCAVAIGKNADRTLLSGFSGDSELVLDANTPNALANIVTSINMPRFSMMHDLVVGTAHRTNGVTVPPPAIVAAISGTSPNNFQSSLAIAYKKSLSKNFIAISPTQIDERIYGKELFVTRKYDGILVILFWQKGKLTVCNSSGNTVDARIPCFAYAASCFKNTGIKEAVIAAELYVDEIKGRTHVFQTLKALTSDKNTLCLAPFNIISYNGIDWVGKRYDETHKTLSHLFEAAHRITPVLYAKAKDKSELKTIFSKWVTEEGSEGLVVHTANDAIPGSGMYKIKQRQTIDASVVGFSEADAGGEVRTLLYALRNEEGNYQIIGRTGNGLDAAQKKELYTKLIKTKITSDYLEVDSNHAAFHIVNPHLVIELSVIDIIAENASGNIKNPVLCSKNDTLKRCGITNGFSFITAVIERLRDDKNAQNADDVRLSQITLPPPEKSETATCQNAPSTLLKRTVYTKGSGGGTAVQKYMVWKTNKTDNYTAYVFSYTNFSATRKDPLSVDVRLSNNESQIMQIYNEFIAKEVKAGWINVT